MGGPILHDKLFFFFDSEWVRIALPIVTPATVPTPAFQQYVCGQLPLGGTDSVTGSTMPRRRNSCPFTRRCFRSIGNTAERRWPCSAVHSTAMAASFRQHRRTAMAAPIAKASPIPATITSKCRPPESTTTSTSKNTTWFRFQADSGLQAAYTDPINPLFNAISPQPLYSFASGYTHVFSQNLVNYFNPAFSWYESLFGASRFSEDAGGVSDRASGQRSQCAIHDYRRPGQYLGSGTSRFPLLHQRQSRLDEWGARIDSEPTCRIFRLNDFDFGEGAVPLVTYIDSAAIHLRCGLYRVEDFPGSPQRAFQFPESRSLCAGHVEGHANADLDFRYSRHIQFESAQSSQRSCALDGSFAAISHDVNQPLSAAIQTRLGKLFSSTPLAILQPRTAVAWQVEPKTVLQNRLRIVQRLLPGGVADMVGMNPPYVQTFQGGLLGTVGGTAIAPGVPNSAVDATVAAIRI